jgi:ribose transport system permease protein
MRTFVSRFTARSPWVWSYVGSVLLWILTGIISTRLSLASLSINAMLAAFLVIPALGQMFVITGGSGGIDLSIPYVMTFSAFLSAGIMNGHDSAAAGGLLAGVGIGVAVGFLNAVIVLGFGIPPIVATLATGFMADSAANVFSSQVSTETPSPMLDNFAHGSLAGIPLMVLLAVGLLLIAGGVLRHTVPGRNLEATGQSEEAAHLAGVVTWRVRAGTYVVSGALAGLAGVLLAGYSGGAFLRMGDPYLLASVAAVVLGGSLIDGGKSTVAGVFGGALFLTFALTLMVITQLAIGLQYVLEGLLIISVLVTASRRRAA